MKIGVYSNDKIQQEAHHINKIETQRVNLPHQSNSPPLKLVGILMH